MTVVRTVTLTEFLLAQIAKDEADARAAAVDVSARWRTDELATSVTGEAGIYIAVGPWECPIGPAARHIARHDPARVLAECEAKRRIVALHETAMTPGAFGFLRSYCGGCGSDEYPGTFPCPTLRLLALPYADHPDYRDEWRNAKSRPDLANTGDGGEAGAV